MPKQVVKHWKGPREVTEAPPVTMQGEGRRGREQPNLGGDVYAHGGVEQGLDGWPCKGPFQPYHSMHL